MRLGPSNDEVLGALRRWLPAQRWFPAKGAPVDAHPTGTPAADVHVERVLDLTTGSDEVRVYLLRLATGPLLHVPIVLSPHELPDASAVIGRLPEGVGRVVLHDGARHPTYWRAVLTAMAWERSGDETDARPSNSDLVTARVVSGEQSNTSIRMPGVAGGAILKVLRSVAPGPNPDLEVPRALARLGWGGAPRPLAWLSIDGGVEGAGDGGDGGDAGDELHLAVLSELVPDAQDGFELASHLARRGESFTGHAAALGALVADLHGALRDAFGAGPEVDAGWLVDDLRLRAALAGESAEVLETRGPAITSLLDRLSRHLVRAAPGGGLPALQRIHGDLHLGQVLRGAGRWHVLDFEGEPLRPLAERTRPDLALRDVAGMLRSFDYAAAVGGATDTGWAEASRAAFCDAYRKTTALDAELLAALELDKALYEVVYETGNRPAWLPIPLGGVDRLLAAPSID